MSLNPSLYSSETDTWETPHDLFKALDSEFAFTLDPCCVASSAKCAKYFTPVEDGLVQEWRGSVFMNPPYGRGMAQWIAKARYEASANADVVVCLVPARTDTRWWHDHVMHAAEIRLLSRRLTFHGAGNKAPFPCAIVVFRRGSGPLRFGAMAA